MATPKLPGEDITKSETPAAKAAEAQAASPKASDAPMTVDQERVLESQVAALRSELLVVNARCEAQAKEIVQLRRQRALDEEAKSLGADSGKLPYAKTRVIGSGRVEKFPGDPLLPEEILGLTEGVHYEHR